MHFAGWQVKCAMALALAVIDVGLAGAARLPVSAAGTGPAERGSAAPGVAAAPGAAALVDASPDGIALASARAAGTVEPSRPDAWGGPRSGQEFTLSDRVVDYRIRASLDPVAHTVDGEETLTWRNRSDRAVRSVYLHLYLNAFEGERSTLATEERELGLHVRDDVAVEDGQWGYIDLVRITQADVAVPWCYVHPDGGPAADHTVVRLELPQPVAPGKTTALQIAFHDQLPRVVARSGYWGSFHLVGQWFPKIGVLELPGERGAHTLQWNVHEYHSLSEFYADFGSFDVRLTVPENYTVGATGAEQGAAQVVAGQATHHFVQADVHDFAWTADRRTAPPLEGEYTGADGVRVTLKVLFPPEYAASAPVILQAALDSLAYFSRTLGPYPYRTLTIVVPPMNAAAAAGMEYPTFFTADGRASVEPGTIAQFATEYTVVHEFGHNYFYGILASNEFEEPMLDEGLNEFWDTRMMRDTGRHIALATKFSKLLLGDGPSMQPYDFDRMDALRSDPSDRLGANSWDRLNFMGFVSTYTRTSTVLHDLETAVGSDAMQRAMHTYYERWKFRHPGVADLRAALAEGTGQPALVEAVFAQQVYAAQKVDDGVESLTCDEDVPLIGSQVVEGKRSEVRSEAVAEQIKREREAWDKLHPDAKTGTGPYPWRTTLVLRHRGLALPQEVLVTLADGSRETVLWNSTERWQRYVWVKPVKVLSVQLDPRGRNTLDANVLDNSRSLEADRRASSRWSGDFAALVQVVLALVAAL